MKNKEKFAKEIAEIACDGGEIAISKETRKPVPCDGCRCIDCALSEKYGCSNAFREWAESEYIEKPVISKRDRKHRRNHQSRGRKRRIQRLIHEINRKAYRR